jgi:signal transduction histidine kinase/ActR/RegA family two-component response regulator
VKTTDATISEAAGGTPTADADPAPQAVRPRGRVAVTPDVREPASPAPARQVRSELQATPGRHPAQLEAAVLQLEQEIERRTARERRDLFLKRLLELFAQATGRKEYLDEALKVVLDFTECRCGGIRVIDEDRRLPYESFAGFSADFWRLENPLSPATDVCACARVARRAPEPQESGQFTANGSFWCDDVFTFVEGLSPEQRARYRGACAREGFASLAIVPVRRQGRLVGLIHVADERRGLMPPSKVECLESMALLLGEAILRFDLEARLRAANALLESRATQLQALAAGLARAEERERQRLAAALHDHLQQLLVAVRYGLATLRPHVTSAEPRRILKQVDDLVGQSIDASRSLAAQLSPPALSDAGLIAGLRWLATWMRATHGLSVELALDATAEPSTENLRLLLFQAVWELLLSAAKHAGADRAHISLQSIADGWLRIEIASDGHGCDPSDGSAFGCPDGVGLWRVRDRVSRVGGRLEAAGESGGNTRLVIEVPASPATESEDSGAAAAEDRPARPKGVGATGRCRLLVADDHAMVRQGLIEILRKQEGFEAVGEAADGRQALEEARRLRPDVVVMDVSMPVMDGVEATRAITTELPEVCVIGLSMHAREDMEPPMREAGAAGYIAKDSPAEEIVAEIRRAFAERRAAR